MPESETAISVPHAATVGATVNAPPSVQLYHQDGRTLQVPEADVERWLRDGFSRESQDIDELRGQIGLLFASAAPAVESFAAEVQKVAMIDTSVTAASYVAERAMEDLVVAWGRLYAAIHARYPVQQADETAEEGQANG